MRRLFGHRLEYTVGRKAIPYMLRPFPASNLTRMRTVWLVLLLVTVALPAFGQPSAPPAPPSPDITRPAGAADDVIVVTASRREEQLLNAPATMTVITEEMIATAPDQSIGGLMRLVPGVNTVQTSARDVNVTTRAATGTLSDSMLVLLDGRSIYQDLFGFVLWDFLPIDTTEVKQIEVIRGPASAVWGANAMTGVINVIAKTPRELQGTTATIRFGQFNKSARGGPFDAGGLFSLTAVHARAPSDRFAYKVSGGVLAQEAFVRPTGTVPGSSVSYPAYTNRGTAQPRLDGRADYDTSGGHHLVVAGGVSGSEGVIHTGLGPLDVHRGSTIEYGRATYSRGKLRLQVFVNVLNADAPSLLERGPDGALLPFMFENQAYDTEFSNLHLLRGRHVLSYGGNYRHNHFNLSFAPASRSRDEGGAYAQDELVLSDRYRWIVGTRVDRFSVLSKAVLSPRTAFLIKPRPAQTIRLSFNRAFRAPSFVNSYLDTTFVTPLDLPGGGSFQFPTRVEGNRQLEAERLTAYEAGYTGKFGRVPESHAQHDPVCESRRLHQRIAAIWLAPPTWSTGSAEGARTGAAGAVHVPELRGNHRSRRGTVGGRENDVGSVRVRQLLTAGAAAADWLRCIRVERAARPPLQHGRDCDPQPLFRQCDSELCEPRLLAGRSPRVSGLDGRLRHRRRRVRRAFQRRSDGRLHPRHQSAGSPDSATHLWRPHSAERHRRGSVPVLTPNRLP
jgi:hypothetical protein